MANKEVVFKLNIDGGNSLSIIKQIQQELGKINNEFVKTNTGAQLDTRIAALSKNLQELKSKGGGESLTAIRQEVKLLDLELSKLPKNTVEYNNKLKELSARKADMADLRTAINALDPEKKVEALAKVGVAITGGFTAALGVSNLLGESNKELEASLVKVQSALGVLQGLQAVVNAKDDLKILAVASGFDKLKGAIFGTAAAGEGANVSFKALRATLASLGIGAIAIGLGLLIENWEKIRTAITGVSKQQAEFNKIRSESLSSIAQERESVGQLVQEYNNAETTDKRRKQIKDELIKKSPEYFGVLNKEKTTVEELTTAYKNWSNAVLLKAENDAIIKKIGEERIKIIEAENKPVTDNVNLFESAVNLITSFGNAAEFAGKQVVKGAENTINSVKEANNNIGVLQQQLIDNQKKLKELGGDPTSSDNSKEEEEARLKAIEEAFKKEVELIKQKEAEKKTVLIQSKPSEDELSIGNLNIELEFINKSIEIYKKYGKDLSDLLLERAQKEYDIEKTTAEQKLKLIEENKKREEDAKKVFEDNSDREYKQDINNLQNYLGQRRKEIANSNLDESEKDRQLTALKKLELESRLKIEQDYGKDVQGVQQEITEFEIEQAEKRKQLQKDIQNSAVEGAVQIMNTLFDVAKENIDAQLEQQKSKIDEQLADTQNKLESFRQSELVQLEIQRVQGLVSETQYQQKKAEIEKKATEEKIKAEKAADKEKRKIERDAAIRQRQLANVQIVINSAIAAMKTLSELGYPAAIPALIALAAQTAAQLIVVNSQPLPALAKGGLINKRYEGGGVIQEGTTPTADDVPILVSRGEAVINAKAVERYKPLLSAMNASTGGRAFAQGGIPLPGSSGNVNNIPLTMDNKEQVELLQQVRDLLSVPNRSYVVESDITSTQRQVSRIEARTEF